MSVEDEVAVLPHIPYKFLLQLYNGKVCITHCIGKMYQGIVEAKAVSWHTDDLRMLNEDLRFFQVHVAQRASRLPSSFNSNRDWILESWLVPLAEWCHLQPKVIRSSWNLQIHKKWIRTAALNSNADAELFVGMQATHGLECVQFGARRIR